MILKDLLNNGVFQQNLANLKQNYKQIKELYIRKVTKKIRKNAVLVFGTVNSAVCKLNAALDSHLQDQLAAKREKKELRDQIALMQAEGNVTSPHFEPSHECY